MDPSTSGFITQKALRYGLHSCSYCQAVLIDLTSLAHPGSQGDSVIEPKKASDDKNVLLFYKDRIFHQFHFSQLTVSAASFTCPLFELLHETGSDDGDWFINLDLSSKRFGVHPSGSYHLRLPTEITSLLPCFDSYGPPIDPRINTEETFANARKWLEKCLREHESCYDKSQQPAAPPSRLLDVRQDKTRLVSTEFLKDPTWAALSYCWGGPQDAQTTHLNVQERYQEIVFEDLPLTIRDGIHVCRQMHIPYLWVDSLCIIQTDSTSVKGGRESDKDRELRKMAWVFSGAILTISASCASSARDGFLQDREVLPPGIALPVRVNDTYDIAQVVRFPRDTFHFEPEPVDSRAWIFQEQRLSRNTLNFRKQAMQWGCLSSGTCFSQHDEYAFQRCRIDGYELGWHALVEEYTQRNISNPRDRPVAIAAVAESFVGPEREDIYLAVSF
ncbi:hypothetical protein LB507_004270 [Fusarium sp. FIESC RH6]|nr:hypothetical protein LB507_004270 [Fusarium sp. FIESC RH6]